MPRDACVLRHFTDFAGFSHLETIRRIVKKKYRYGILYVIFFSIICFFSVRITHIKLINENLSQILDRPQRVRDVLVWKRCVSRLALYMRNTHVLFLSYSLCVAKLILNTRLFTRRGCNS